MQYKAICLIICSLLAANNARALQVCGELKQGEMLVLKDKGLQKVRFQNNLGAKEYAADDEGNVIAALHRDAPNKVKMQAVYQDKVADYVLKVAKAKWDIQSINGVAQSKVTPSKSATDEIKREQQDVGRAVNVKSNSLDWKNGFMLPLEGRISGNFGNQRIFNGVPKSPHSGTDIAAAEGTPLKAAGDGKVILSGKDYFYTGNMVIIDHGYGLQTIYAHLLQAKVKEGETVHKGDVVGLVGKTGRATGPHLHWGASLNNVRFRPHSLLDINEKKCRIIKGDM